MTAPNSMNGNTRREKREVGLVANIQRFSLHDGPGIRTTVFMKGCPLCCEWCCNPEAIKRNPEIMTFQAKCIKCENCAGVCPRGAISVVGGSTAIDWKECDQCLKCAEVCPSGAIETIGEYTSCEGLMKEIVSDLPFYESSGGGVTFSGGEPLVQWEFVLRALKQCKAKNIHTCVDTTGHVPWEVIEKTIPYVDLYLYDLKHFEAESQKERTGVDNRMILANLSNLARSARIWLRVPLIPGFNDSEYHLKKVGQLAVTLRVEKVCLLPYHCWGESKYERLGRTYYLSGVSPPTEEDMEKHKETLRGVGAEVSIGR